ncbi:MAG: hypothetical protein GMKNLPBB_00017 [Myxococcota bacterium]|nr:hypothetical protein [Myxococcota bacterium]
MDKPSSAWRWIRILAPWFLGIAIVAALIRFVSPDAFLEALRQADAARVMAVLMGYFIAALPLDALGYWSLLRDLRSPVRYRDVLLARGASLAFGVLNYTVGQGGLAWILHKSAGVDLARCGLLVLFISAADLFLIALAAALTTGSTQSPALGIIQTAAWVILAATAAYAALKLFWRSGGGMRETPPTRRGRILAVLRLGMELSFAAHIRLALLRAPRIAVIFTGFYLLLPGFQLQAGLAELVAAISATTLAGAIPLTPFGLGTTHALGLELMKTWGPQARILAYGLVPPVVFFVLDLAAGLGCLAAVRARGWIGPGAAPREES